MNILVLNYEYPPIGGGGAIVCKELCQMESHNGNNVEVVTMAFDGLPHFEEIEGVKVHRVKCWRKEARVCHPWEQMSYCINAYKHICNNIDMDKVDIIHCHFIIPTGLLAVWLRKYKKKLVITAHGSDVLGHNNTRFKVIYKLIKPIWIRIIKNSNIVTAPSEYLVNKIKESYPKVNCECIPNGIHTDEYKAGEKKRSIITLTRLQESKGIQDLIEACAEIDIKDWEINILGDGPFRKNLEALVEQKGLQNKIFLRGHVVGDLRKKFLSEAGIFFSGSHFEAFSLSVLEASLSGCNIIASNIEPHVMLVGNEHIYRDQNQLKAMLADAINKVPRIYQYGNEKYDWEVIYDQYMGLFESVIREK